MAPTTKKRVYTSSDDELTPKKRKIAPPTPPCSPHKPSHSLPAQLSRLDNLHTALQHALSHALATYPSAPSEAGILRNVLNHISIVTYSGFTTQFGEDELKRLCWIWEWDPASPPPSTNDDTNPFLVSTTPQPPKDWIRGSMGFIVSSTSHYSKTAEKRVPVYGIGVKVDMDLDKSMNRSMAAIARWTAGAEKRRAEFRSKLNSWAEHHSNVTPLPNIPLADLPQLVVQKVQPSSLTRTLASASPKGAAVLGNILSSAPSSPSKSPSKSSVTVPFPIAKPHLSEPSPTKSFALLLRTPSRPKRTDPLAGLLTPRTPARKRLETQGSDTPPTTPVHQRGPDAETMPSTPSTSRRQALYERVRLKSLASTPAKAKAKSAEIIGGKLTKEQLQKMGQEEIRRRCLLGRLGGVAESIWMLFSSAVGSSATTAIPTTRKRKALPASEVIRAVKNSSPVPISTLEASDSLKLLTSLCPFFLRPLTINGEEWLETPPTALTSDATEGSSTHDTPSPTKSSAKNPAAPPSPGFKVPPASPGSKASLDSAEQLITRSPRTVKREVGGIRRVREIIRKELELHD